VRNGQALITRYRVRWLLLVALFVIVVAWLVVISRPAPVAPGDVRSAVHSENPPAQRLEGEEEMLERLKANMTELELTVSASEGQLRLRVWAAAARKDETRYEIDDGLLQFEMENRDTLLLRVEDALLTLDPRLTRMFSTLDSLWWMSTPVAGLLRVERSLTGIIIERRSPGQEAGTNSYFEATGLLWDGIHGMINAGSVTYSAGDIEVNGQSMLLNLRTGEINFEGAVEASL
jgi:hypothetical protein